MTGHTEDGRSTILIDGPAPQVSEAPDPRGGSTVLWVTDGAPASNESDRDMAPGGRQIPVPPEARGGSVFRIVDFVPGAVPRFRPDSAVQQTPERAARHAGFHKTDTVDYAIVLEGEIWAVLDETETLLRTGDVLIQRGTYHAWDNRAQQVCRMAFILLDAVPI